jgi:predicted esterase
LPAGATAKPPRPCLLILSCTGAHAIDLDTCRIVSDSLGWALATCHATRNHRSSELNSRDVQRTLLKLRRLPIDTTRVFVVGFSGQAVQALATLFEHPDLVRGVAATCAHAGAVPLADFDLLEDRYVYLVTREKDWNRLQNERMSQLFNGSGLATKLVMTAGDHGPGPSSEMLAACRWLQARTR